MIQARHVGWIIEYKIISNLQILVCLYSAPYANTVSSVRIHTHAEVGHSSYQTRSTHLKFVVKYKHHCRWQSTYYKFHVKESLKKSEHLISAIK